MEEKQLTEDELKKLIILLAKKGKDLYSSSIHTTVSRLMAYEAMINILENALQNPSQTRQYLKFGGCEGKCFYCGQIITPEETLYTQAGFPYGRNCCSDKEFITQRIRLVTNS